MKNHFSFLMGFLFSIGIMAQPCIPNTHSLMFDGYSSSVKISSFNNLQFTGAFSIEAWIYPTAFGVSYTKNSIFCHHSWDPGLPDTYGYVLRCGSDGFGNGILSFNIGTPSGWLEVTSPAGSLMLNNWSHVAGTFDGTTLKCYINGNLQASTPYTGTILTSPFPPRIGALSDTAVSGSPRYFSGYIDEVRVWNVARSSTELTTNMNDHLNPSGQTNLAGYWRFNEGTTNITADLSGNGDNGICYNTSWTLQVPFNNPPPPVPIITLIGLQLHSSASTGNQWYLNGLLISGATQQNYTPTVNGSYHVVVTGSNNCTTASVPYVLTTVGIEENHTGVWVSPNPACEYLMVRQEGIGNYINFQISNLTGTIIMKGDLSDNAENKINISICKPGIYILSVVNDKGEKIAQKFLVE